MVTVEEIGLAIIDGRCSPLFGEHLLKDSKQVNNCPRCGSPISAFSEEEDFPITYTKCPHCSLPIIWTLEIHAVVDKDKIDTEWWK